MARSQPLPALAANEGGVKTLMGLVLMVGILWFANPVLIPVALAIMLNLLLAPGCRTN